MDDLALARRFLLEDPLFYVNMLEVLRRGSAEVLAAEERGVVLLDHGSGSYMFALEEGAADLLDLIPGDAELVTGHALWCLPLLEERLGLHGRKIVRSAAWTASQPPPPPEFEGELRLLGPEWARWAAEHYSSDFGGLDYMLGAVERGLLGAFVDGAPAGFVGFHDEGSIGMLEVLPEYRRRGLGEALEAGAVRLALSRGQYAFGQVETENGVSLALQKKVGLEISDRELFWLFE